MSSKKFRKICVVTGSRAEYGLLYWLMKDIKDDESLILQTVVTGAHLSSIHGYSYKVIEQEFTIDDKVDMKLTDDSALGITKSLGLGVMGFAESFYKLKPDIIVVLGDRYEILGAVQAALIAQIPVAHIQGGEITQGAFDESIRHAITKMSHFHFTTAEENSKRVIQMGESPKRVFTLGAPGLDNFMRLSLLSKEELEKNLNIKLGKQNFLVTYHPVTLSKESPEKPFQELLDALDEFSDSNIIFTKPNADTNSSIISKMIEEYVSKNKQRASCFSSLGQLRYLSLLKLVDAMIGNSSSGILEAPTAKVPTVNIGDRQKGRLCSKSVLHCNESKDKIIEAIQKSQTKEFREMVKTINSPYDCENISGKIKDTLKAVSLDNVIMKTFFEVEYKL